MLKIKKASEGKVWAYKNDKGEEITLGRTLYLGVDDDSSRYYEIPKPKEDIVIENTQNEQ